MKTRPLAAIASVLLNLHSPMQAQWVQTNGPYDGTVNALAVSGSKIVAGTRGGGIFLSTNNGTSWQPINYGLGDSVVYSLAISGSKIVAGTYRGASQILAEGQGAIVLSTNSGASWQTVDTCLPGRTVLCFALSESSVFAGTEQFNGGPGTILSAKEGTSWKPLPFAEYRYTFVSCLLSSGSSIFAGTGGLRSGVFQSTDNGTSWQAADSGITGGVNVRALIASGSDLFAGTDIGVYLSTNVGVSWKPVNAGLPDYVNHSGWISAFAVNANVTSGMNLFAGTAFDGVFISTNNGTSWSAVNAGLANDTVLALAVSGANLFAGTSTGVWRRPLSEIVTTVREAGGAEMPLSFQLEQNYPNPFNPLTVIRYGIPSRSHVLLTVFNILGQKIADLVNGDINAGYHEVLFNAGNLASGVYMYRIQTGRYVETKKLVLAR